MNLVDYGPDIGPRIRMLVEAMLYEQEVTPDWDFEFDTWECLSDDWDINVWGNPEDGISVGICPVVNGETRSDMMIILEGFTYMPKEFVL